MTRALLISLLLTACIGDTSKDFGEATDDSEPELDSPEDSPEPPDGEALFAEHCARCHGEDGRGGRGGPDLSRELNNSDEQLIGVILNGEGDMPAAEVSEEEAQAIVDWLRESL